MSPKYPMRCDKATMDVRTCMQGPCNEITHLLRKTAPRYELESLHLPKMRGKAEHMHVHEFGDAAMPVLIAILLPERLPQRCALLSHCLPLLRRCLAGPHSTNQIPAHMGCFVAVYSLRQDACA